MAAPLLLIERGSIESLEGPVREAWNSFMTSDPTPPSRSGAAVVRHAPSFYDDVDLIEIAAQDWIPAEARCYYLHHAGKFYRLNGSSAPIHEINAAANIVITESSVLDYLAFFCFFVRGTDGPFLIVDRLDNAYLPRIADVEGLRKAFRKPALWGQDENGDWRASCLVYYSDGLFLADFLIHLDGNVEMKNDQVLFTGTGKKVHAPLDVDGNRNG